MRYNWRETENGISKENDERALQTTQSEFRSSIETTKRENLTYSGRQ